MTATTPVALFLTTCSLLLCGCATVRTTPQTAADLPAEGSIKHFLGEPQFDEQQVFKGDRFPNIVTAVDGTVLNVWGGVQLRRSEDGGKTWGPTIPINKGLMSGGVTVDETTGRIWAFVEQKHPPAPYSAHVSDDHGKTWTQTEISITPNSLGHLPAMHMNEHGITLRHGKYAGRIIRASRYYGITNQRNEWPDHYTNAIYSDDHGDTWKTSEPFPAKGTGEATIAELSDGTLYYNSRRHWAPEGESPLRRWTATSTDGGHTWNNLTFCETLPDGDQGRSYGLMAGLTRLPVTGQDILIFSNIISPKNRENGFVWASFDGGKTWPIKRRVTKGPFAYSSLTCGRPGTPSEGWIYLSYENKGSQVARFNLSWVLEGEPTNNGTVPDWAHL